MILHIFIHSFRITDSMQNKFAPNMYVGLLNIYEPKSLRNNLRNNPFLNFDLKNLQHKFVNVRNGSEGLFFNVCQYFPKLFTLHCFNTILCVRKFVPGNDWYHLLSPLVHSWRGNQKGCYQIHLVSLNYHYYASSYINLSKSYVLMIQANNHT